LAPVSDTTTGEGEGSEDDPFEEDFLQDVIKVGWPNKWKNAACFAGDVSGDFCWSRDCLSWAHYFPRSPLRLEFGGAGAAANSASWTRTGVKSSGDPLWLHGCTGEQLTGQLDPIFNVAPLSSPVGCVFRSARYGSDTATVHVIPGSVAVFNIYGSKIDKRIYCLAIMSDGSQVWFSSVDGKDWGNTGPPTPPKGSFAQGIPQRTLLYQISANFAQGVDEKGNPCEVSIDYSPADFLGFFGGGQGFGVPFQVSRLVEDKKTRTITKTIVLLPFLPICCVSDSKSTFVLGGWGQGDINNFDYPGCVAYSQDAGKTWFSINRVTFLPVHTIACGPRPKKDN
jgi:hypothetical protein